MKILFIGTLAPGQTSEMRMKVLRSFGHEVIGIDSQKPWSAYGPLKRRLYQTLGRGTPIRALNNLVIESVATFKPDLVWAEKQEYLTANTVRSIRDAGARSLHFTPDPYFTLEWKRTSSMDKAISLFDYLVTAKRYELTDYQALGPKVLYMPLGFSEDVHRPLSPAVSSTATKFSSDVAFLGGWEPRRESMLRAIVSKVPCKLNVWGYGWDHLADGRLTLRRAAAMRRNAGHFHFKVTKDERLAASVIGGEVYADEYAWALSGARIGIGFLRTICPDQHTTRTFEIPACGSMLLADRTDEHREYFREGVEADFFGSEDEMIDKLRFYLGNEDARAAIARRGLARCHSSGYSYTSRLAQLMEQIEQ